MQTCGPTFALSGIRDIVIRHCLCLCCPPHVVNDSCVGLFDVITVVTVQGVSYLPGFLSTSMAFDVAIAFPFNVGWI